MLDKVKPFPIVLVAPSGTGKTTLCGHILEKYHEIKYSISATTREPRKGEIDEEDYYFLSKSTFKEWIKGGKFYEWAEVYDNLYGTPKEFLTKYLNEGHNVLLDLDIQGAKAVKLNYPSSVCIFILPPSTSELENRLLKRNTDLSEVINKRLQSAELELSYLKEFDYVIVNKDVKATVEKIAAIIVAERCKTERL